MVDRVELANAIREAADSAAATAGALMLKGVMSWDAALDVVDALVSVETAAQRDGTFAVSARTECDGTSCAAGCPWAQPWAVIELTMSRFTQEWDVRTDVRVGDRRVIVFGF